MKREDKSVIIEQLTEQINQANNFYLADISELNAEQTFSLRSACFKDSIKLTMVKNTLLKIALEKSEKNLEEVYPVLKQNTSIMFCDIANAPAKVIKAFRKENDRPILKAAFVQESIYLGDEMLDSLVNIKSKEELLGDVIGLLQSPMNNVVSALQSGKNTLAGVVKTLSERE